MKSTIATSTIACPARVLVASAVAVTLASAALGETKPDGTGGQTVHAPASRAEPVQGSPAPVPGAKPASAPKESGTAATVVNLQTIESVMGKSVKSRTNEDMGRIVDVLVDRTGQIRAAVIDFGGFLGVGSRKVAVAWKTLDFTDSIQNGSTKVTLTRDQVRQSPEYKLNEPIVILEGAAAQKPASAAAPDTGHNQARPAR